MVTYVFPSIPVDRSQIVFRFSGKQYGTANGAPGGLVRIMLAPVAADQGQGHGKPGNGQAQGDEEQKSKPPKGAKSTAAKHVDDRARFHGLDKNHDGVVTRAEWNGDGRSFAHHDWNHDGRLSGAEIDPAAPRQEPLHARPLPLPPAPPAAKAHTESDEVLFARRDTNHDQRISRSEWVGDAVTFERLDFNKDGWLSPYRVRRRPLTPEGSVR